MAAGLTAFWLAPAAAQDPGPRAFTATGDFSFVNTSGNRDLVTLGLGEKVEWRLGGDRVTIKQGLSWIYGTSEGVENANQLATSLRGELQLSRRLDLFLGAGYDYNLYAGIARRFEEFAGVGIQVLDGERHRLRLDGGFSHFQEWALLEPEASVFTTGRLVGDYRHHFTDKAYAQQVLEYQPNIENGNDYRLNAESALVAPLNSFLGLKMNYVVRTRGAPPEGFERTDTIFRAGVQVTF